MKKILSVIVVVLMAQVAFGAGYTSNAYTAFSHTWPDANFVNPPSAARNPYEDWSWIDCSSTTDELSSPACGMPASGQCGWLGAAADHTGSFNGPWGMGAAAALKICAHSRSVGDPGNHIVAIWTAPGGFVGPYVKVTGKTMAPAWEAARSMGLTLNGQKVASTVADGASHKFGPFWFHVPAGQQLKVRWSGDGAGGNGTGTFGGWDIDIVEAATAPYVTNAYTAFEHSLIGGVGGCPNAVSNPIEDWSWLQPESYTDANLATVGTNSWTGGCGWHGKSIYANDGRGDLFIGWQACFVTEKTIASHTMNGQFNPAICCRDQGVGRHYNALWTAPMSLTGTIIKITGKTCIPGFEATRSDALYVNSTNVDPNNDIFLCEANPDNLVGAPVVKTFGPIYMPVAPGQRFRFRYDGSGAHGNMVGTWSSWDVSITEITGTVGLTVLTNPPLVTTTQPHGFTAVPIDDAVALAALPYYQCQQLPANDGNDVYEFVNWTGPVVDPNSASTSITINTATTITANYVLTSACGDMCHQSGSYNPPGRNNLQPDMNADCKVDMTDFAMFAAQWLVDHRPSADGLPY